MPAGVCRMCGCTDEDACPEGCTWVQADLCSECVRHIDPKVYGAIVDATAKRIGKHSAGCSSRSCVVGALRDMLSEFGVLRQPMKRASRRRA